MMRKGKFHSVMIATTPIGSLIVIAMSPLPRAAKLDPLIERTWDAAYGQSAADRSISARLLQRCAAFGHLVGGEFLSAHEYGPRCSLKHYRRSSPERSDQQPLSNASFAQATAALTSPGVATQYRPTIWALAGFSRANASPSPLTQRP
jgi:hypothetical protein